MSSIKLTDDAHCFVCGKANIHGLQLVWNTQGSATQAEFYPPSHVQGWQGIVHGGVLAAVLDEGMTRLAWERHGGVVTGEITVRYYKPARVGERLFVKGEILPTKSRIIPGKAEIRNAAGHLVASAKGKIFKVAQPSSSRQEVSRDRLEEAVR